MKMGRQARRSLQLVRKVLNFLGLQSRLIHWPWANHWNEHTPYASRRYQRKHQQHNHYEAAEEEVSTTLHLKGILQPTLKVGPAS